MLVIDQQVFYSAAFAQCIHMRVFADKKVLPDLLTLGQFRGRNALCFNVQSLLHDPLLHIPGIAIFYIA
ncbi:hypothetical protein D3C80_1571870 [compost metagenome]